MIQYVEFYQGTNVDDSWTMLDRKSPEDYQSNGNISKLFQSAMVRRSVAFFLFHSTL